MEYSSENEPVTADPTGCNSFSRNLMYSWGGYGVNLIAGFVLPRMVDDRLGQFQLGVWDFAWTMIGYLGLMELGIGGADRLFAKNLATGDTTELTRSVSSMAFCMNIIGILMLLGTILVALFVVPSFQSRLGAFTTSTQWVVFLLGLGVAIEVCIGVYWCIIVAVHRWDVHNTISSAVSLTSTVGMILAMLLGGGLVWMAAIQSCTMTVGHLCRYRMASRVCPCLQFDLRTADFCVVREQMHYAAKNLLPRVADMLVNQTVSLLLVSFSGPAALAVFARPRALTKHVRTLVGKFSSILIPSASAMQALEDHGGLRQMLLRRSEQASSFSVPAILWLTVIGGPVIELWMGKDYFHPGLVPVLALGFIASLVQDPVWAIMTGLNRHGHIAIVKFGGSVACAGAVALGLHFGHDKLLWAAAGLALPMLIVDGIAVPILACRSMGVPLLEFYQLTLIKPFKLFLPAGICLVAARVIFDGNLLRVLAVGGGIAGIIQIGMYYRFVFSESLRTRLRRVIALART